eukprot:3940510-Prymnesium_polylepis.2
MRRGVALVAVLCPSLVDSLVAVPSIKMAASRVGTLAMQAGDATPAEIRAAMLSAGGAPVAKTVPSQQVVEVAGTKHTLDDEYQWMRGQAWPKLVKDEDIIAHLEAENAYCKDFLASLGDLQETFFQTMKGRMKLTDRTVEVRHGAYYYYGRTEEALQYSIDCRVPVTLFDELKGLNGSDLDDALRRAEEVVLDRNKLAEGKAFCKALATTVSLNGKLMAYRVECAAGPRSIPRCLADGLAQATPAALLQPTSKVRCAAPILAARKATRTTAFNSSIWRRARTCPTSCGTWRATASTSRLTRTRVGRRRSASSTACATRTCAPRRSSTIGSAISARAARTSRRTTGCCCSRRMRCSVSRWARRPIAST